MKHKSIILLYSIAIISLFSSCVEVPDNIQNSPDEISVTSFDKEETAERGNISEIRSQLPNDLSKQYDNIIIENARVGEGNIMPSYDVMIAGKKDVDIKPITKYVYGDSVDTDFEGYYHVYKKNDPIDTKYPATFEPSDYAGDGIRTPNYYSFDIQEFKPDPNDITKSFYHYSMGNLWGSAVGALNNSYYYFEELRVSERYDLKYDTIDGDLSYPMEDGISWNVLEAISYVEKFWNEYLSVSDTDNYTYSVKTLYVIALEDDTYGYLFEMERKDENGNYYEVDSGYIEDRNKIESNLPFKIDNTQMTWMTKKEVFTRLIKDYSIQKTSQTSEGNNLLTLSGAADILSNSLASNINLKINSAELNYVITCKGYPYYEIWEHPEYFENICLETCDFEIKPYWCFRPTQNTLCDYMECEIYFIDAVSGELEIMKY